MSCSPQSTTASTNSEPDVVQLAGESLRETSFPAPRQASFRVHFDSQAYTAMIQHASEDVSVEICGVLVGDWERDADGPFVTVRNFIRCDSAAKKFAEVTFTHESWSHINKEMDTKFQAQRIVGWYHSHPNFGVFLSDRDLFIQQNFFSGPGQIALVIDPVRKIEGVFEWRRGNATPTPYYWVDGRVLVAPAAADVAQDPGSHFPIVEDQTQSITSVNSNAINLGPSGVLLVGVGLFLMGWLLSGWRSEMDRRAIIEGTVAHFGIWKGLKPGFEQAMNIVREDVEAVSNQTKQLASDHMQRLADDEKLADQARQEWDKLREMVDVIRNNLKQIESRYALTPDEYEAVRRYVEQKIIEASREGRAPDDPQAAEQSAGPNESKSKSTKTPDKSVRANPLKTKEVEPRKP